MSAFNALLFSFLTFRSSAYTFCPPSQQVDTNKICEIFKHTNIESLSYFPHYNFSDKDYCDWYSAAIQCDSYQRIITVDISGLVGNLDFTYGWPSALEILNLEQYDQIQPGLSGQFDWSSLQPLTQLYELDLELNNFSGVITNNDWNMLAALPNLFEIDLEYDLFDCNFSEINITTDSSTTLLQLSGNNFYGTITTEFINRFPRLRTLDLEENNLHGHFENFDVFANLRRIKLGHNHFSGTVAMHLFQNLSDDLAFVRLDHNNFSGEIDWNLFIGKYALQEIDLNNNSFTGTINWNIIADLYNNGVLDHLDLRDNYFTGYVDFSWLTDSIFEMDVDVNVHCDPQIYPCPNGRSADRTQVFCYTKSDCEATCQCLQTYEPTAIPTSVPTISPSINIVSTNIESDSVNAQPQEFSILNGPYIIIIILTLVCSAGCCIVVGLAIGCYCISYRKRLDQAKKEHTTNSIAIHTGGLPKLPAIASPTLPALPKEQWDDNGNQQDNDEEAIGLQLGESTLGDSMYKVEGKMALTNYKSGSNSEAMYVHHIEHETKGKLMDNTSISMIQTIDETIEDV